MRACMLEVSKSNKDRRGNYRGNPARGPLTAVATGCLVSLRDALSSSPSSRREFCKAARDRRPFIPVPTCTYPMMSVRNRERCTTTAVATHKQNRRKRLVFFDFFQRSSDLLFVLIQKMRLTCAEDIFCLKLNCRRPPQVSEEFGDLLLRK